MSLDKRGVTELLEHCAIGAYRVISSAEREDYGVLNPNDSLERR